MKKFYPSQMMGRYNKFMLDYLAYLFPDKKFSLYEFNMYHAIFMKGHDIGYSNRVMEESEEK